MSARSLWIVRCTSVATAAAGQVPVGRAVSSGFPLGAPSRVCFARVAAAGHVFSRQGLEGQS